MDQANQQTTHNHSTNPKPSVSTFDTAKQNIQTTWDNLQNNTPILSNTPAIIESARNEIAVNSPVTKTDATKGEVDNIFDALHNEENKGALPGEWSWGDGLKGEGKKPEWIRKEFKTVEAQAKSYNELIKKFGDFHGAPEAYDFKNVENTEFHIHAEADNSKKFAAIAKEMGLSQDGFEKILGFFNKTVAPTFKSNGAKPVDSYAEIAKLGENGKEKVKILDQWLMNNHPENYQTLRTMMKTADQINAFWSMREMTSSKEEGHLSIMHRSNPQGLEQQHASLKSELARALKEGDETQKEAIFAKYTNLFNQ